MAKPTCMHCGKEGVPRTGKQVYPNRPDLHSKQFFACPACSGVYIGCHATGRPFGPVMVNKATRAARMAAHTAFDQLWKRDIVSRQVAYQMLARFLGVTRDKAHIGHLNEGDALKVIDWAKHHLKVWRQCGCIDVFDDTKIKRML